MRGKFNTFGKGKTRVCCNLWQDNKSGKYFKYIKGKWIDVTKHINAIDEVLEEIENESEKVVKA